MQVRRVCLNPSFANSYLIIEGESAILIDPGFNEGGALENFISSLSLSVEAILLTHAHYDHFAGLLDWQGAIPPIHIGRKDIPALKDPYLNASFLFGRPIRADLERIIPLDDEQKLAIKSIEIEVIATPYHTRGGVCYYLRDEGIIFSGDSLFRGSVGRSDLPGSEPSLMRESLAKLSSLPEGTRVYPGHGEDTTIGFELRSNPFLSLAK